LITRQLLKKLLITIPYNVSIPRMIDYLKVHFTKLDNEDNKKCSIYTSKYQFKIDPDLILNSKDLALIATGLKEVLKINFPKLKLLIKYLKSIVKLYNKLKIPIQ